MIKFKTQQQQQQQQQTNIISYQHETWIYHFRFQLHFAFG